MTTHLKKQIMMILSRIIFLLIAAGCSATENISEEKIGKTDEDYVFDEVPESDILTFNSPEETPALLYVIQIGAFSTKERAEYFAERSRIFFNWEFNTSYNENVKLYVVRSKQIFDSRSEAEKIRNDLWQYEDYNDAWIVTIKESNPK